MVDTYPDTEFAGAVDNVSPVIEGKSRTQAAKIRIKNPKGQMLPGMFARVLCAVYKASGAVIIPNTALDKTEEGYIVYVVKKAEKKEQKETTAGKEDLAEKMKMQIPKQEKTEAPAQEAAEEEGLAETRKVKIDYRAAESAVIKEGLEEGDLVVVETQEKLKDGYKVIITESQEAAP